MTRTLTLTECLLTSRSRRLQLWWVDRCRMRDLSMVKTGVAQVAMQRSSWMHWVIRVVAQKMCEMCSVMCIWMDQR